MSTNFSSHLTVELLDNLEFDPSISKLDREKALESRKGFYQNQFKTLEMYGGMNTLDSNHIFFKSTNQWVKVVLSFSDF